LFNCSGLVSFVERKTWFENLNKSFNNRSKVENEIKLKLSVGQEDKRNVEVKEDSPSISFVSFGRL
jgi:hypothetical protein